MSDQTKFFVATIVGALILLFVLIWFARPVSDNDKELGAISQLEVASHGYDFGSISMAAGKVKYVFSVKNSGTEPAEIEKVYTSCMCTEATLKVGEKVFGPYGMPGHGFIPKIGQNLSPGEEAEVEVVFDPAAHGPAGVGKVERIVFVESNKGRPLELRFSATVTP